MISPPRVLTKILILGTVVAALAACSGIDIKPPADPYARNPKYMQQQSILGDNTLLFGGSKKNNTGPGTGIGVNSYLWRASLDTLLFMPVTSADPFGGVIITDWHTPPDSPANERFKLNIYILGRALRADGVRVAVFRQVKKGDAWQDEPVAESVNTKIEDAILTKARQLRNETVNQ